MLLPMTAGEIVLAYNIPGVASGLKLPRDVYPDIFLGKITKWNDPRIAAANPGVKLPDLPITVVRRSDSSGTTFVFTKHLSAISDAFKNGPGFGTSVQWPSQRQNRRGAEKRRHHRDDQADAGRDRLYRVWLRQADQGACGGACRTRRANTSSRARRRARRRSPRPSSRPTCGPGSRTRRARTPTRSRPSPGCCSTRSRTRRRRRCLRKLVEYSLTKGQAIADSMGYIPLPAAVVEKVKAAAAQIQ